MEITISITDVQKRALEHVMYDIKDWVQEAVEFRARVATEELLQEETQRLIKDPNVTTIPANKDEIILNSPIETAKERTLRIESEDCETCTTSETVVDGPLVIEDLNEALQPNLI
jgi:hypothetical protein